MNSLDHRGEENNCCRMSTDASKIKQNAEDRKSIWEGVLTFSLCGGTRFEDTDTRTIGCAESVHGKEAVHGLLSSSRRVEWGSHDECR